MSITVIMLLYLLNAVLTLRLCTAYYDCTRRWPWSSRDQDFSGAIVVAALWPITLLPVVVASALLCLKPGSTSVKALKSVTDDPEVQAAYDALVKELRGECVDAEFHELEKPKVKVRIAPPLNTDMTNVHLVATTGMSIRQLKMIAEKHNVPWGPLHDVYEAAMTAEYASLTKELNR